MLVHLVFKLVHLVYMLVHFVPMLVDLVHMLVRCVALGYVALRWRWRCGAVRCSAALLCFASLLFVLLCFSSLPYRILQTMIVFCVFSMLDHSLLFSLSLSVVQKPWRPEGPLSHAP